MNVMIKVGEGLVAKEENVILAIHKREKIVREQEEKVRQKEDRDAKEIYDRQEPVRIVKEKEDRIAKQEWDRQEKIRNEWRQFYNSTAILGGIFLVVIVVVVMVIIIREIWISAIRHITRIVISEKDRIKK